MFHAWNEQRKEWRENVSEADVQALVKYGWIVEHHNSDGELIETHFKDDSGRHAVASPKIELAIKPPPMTTRAKKPIITEAWINARGLTKDEVNAAYEWLEQIDQLAKQARRDINHGRPPEAIKSLDRIIELLKGTK